MKRGPNIKPLARERVKTLFIEASSAFKKHPERSHRYVAMALRLAAKAHIRIPIVYRRKYCRSCEHYLVSGSNATVRTRNKKLIITCKDCKKQRRIVLKPKVLGN